MHCVHNAHQHQPIQRSGDTSLFASSSTNNGVLRQSDESQFGRGEQHPSEDRCRRSKRLARDCQGPAHLCLDNTAGDESAVFELLDDSRGDVVVGVGDYSSSAVGTVELTLETYPASTCLTPDFNFGTLATAPLVTQFNNTFFAGSPLL